MIEDLNAVNATVDPRAKEEHMAHFLAMVNQSGVSSWELLQNVYSPRRGREQGLALALTVTRHFLRSTGADTGACRVHGGGFAGTIQAYIPLDMINPYRITMERIFSPGAVTVLRIRPVGAEELVFAPGGGFAGLRAPSPNGDSSDRRSGL
jgi:galactokinase